VSKGGAKSHRVLLVDDDPVFLTTTQALLDELFDVVTCGEPEAALGLLKAQPHVVCCDFEMPKMNGVEFLRRALAVNDTVSCLLLTGGDEYFASGNSGEYYVLRKPFSPPRLISMVVHLAGVAASKRSVRAGARPRG
jgi:CheY-like chemotaxis protein